MGAIRRATEAKRRGGPDGPTGLAIAAMLPSVEELGDRLQRMAGEAGEEMGEAEALAVAHEVRQTMLDTLEKALTGRAG